MKTSKILLLLLFLSCVADDALALDSLFTVPVDVEQRCLDQVCFPAIAVHQGESYRLVGLAKYRYLFLSCYIAALYTPSGAATLDSYLDDQTKLLAVHYLRDIEVDRITASSTETIDDHPDHNSSDFQAELDQLYALFHGVSEGDRAALVFEPETGVSLHFNSKKLGTVAGRDFLRAYAAIWMSPHSVGRRFTRQLLGLVR